MLKGGDKKTICVTNETQTFRRRMSLQLNALLLSSEPRNTRRTPVEPIVLLSI